MFSIEGLGSWSGGNQTERNMNMKWGLVYVVFFVGFHAGG